MDWFSGCACAERTNRRRRRGLLLLAVVCGLACHVSRAQVAGEAPLPDDPSAAPVSGGHTDEVSVRGVPRRVVLNEWQAVTSPARVRRCDLVWLLPLAGASAASFATDVRAMRDVVTDDAGATATAAG